MPADLGQEHGEGNREIERTGGAEVIQGLVRPDLRIDCLDCSGHLDDEKASTEARSGELIRVEDAGRAVCFPHSVTCSPRRAELPETVTCTVSLLGRWSINSYLVLMLNLHLQLDPAPHLRGIEV